MYKLFDEKNICIGCFDKIHYVKKSKAGCFNEADFTEAIAVVVNNSVYRLNQNDLTLQEYPYANVIEVNPVVHFDSITDYNNILSKTVTDVAEIYRLTKQYYPVYWTKVQILHLVKCGFLPLDKMVEANIFNAQEQVDNLAIFKQGKIAELSQKCQEIIECGVDVDITREDQTLTEHFSADEVSQRNVTNLYHLVSSGVTEYPYHADGKECLSYTATDITKIYVTMQSSIIYNTTYFNMIRVMVERAIDLNGLTGIAYGIKLPIDLKAEMDKNLQVAQAQNQKIGIVI